MPAANFANHARMGPNPATTAHAGVGGNTSYTCHMAAMHWAFMDLGDNMATAHAKVEAINRAKCLGCLGLHHLHGSISPNWYGQHFTTAGAVALMHRGVLYPSVNAGDVLILPRPQAPMHSMVVVSKSSWFGHTFVYIRGFNNTNTLGTGPFLRYDNADRDVDRAAYWHGVGQVFGLGAAAGGRLYKVPYANYSASAAVVRANCNFALGVWTYVGP